MVPAESGQVQIGPGLLPEVCSDRQASRESVPLMHSKKMSSLERDDDSCLPQDYLSTNWRLMLLSGTRTVRVMGLIGRAPGSGSTSKWVKICNGAWGDKVVTMGGSKMGP